MIQNILDLKKQGYSILKISKTLKISRGIITKILNGNIDTIRLDNLNIKLSQEQIDLIIGSTLGDASIRNRNNRCHVRFMHSTKQEEYLKFKYDILKNISGKISYYKRKYIKIDGSVYVDVSFSTKTMKEINKYYDMFYINGIKHVPKNLKDIINPRIISYWYMDDGYLSKGKSFFICTNSFDNNDQNIMIDAFLKYDIEISFTKRNELMVKAKSRENFKKLISEYIIDSMLYKLPGGSR